MGPYGVLIRGGISSFFSFLISFLIFLPLSPIIMTLVRRLHEAVQVLLLLVLVTREVLWVGSKVNARVFLTEHANSEMNIAVRFILEENNCVGTPKERFDEIRRLERCFISGS